MDQGNKLRNKISRKFGKGTCKPVGMGDWEKPSRVEHHSSVCGKLQSRSQSKQNNRDRRNHEKQHNYVKELPSFKGANPPSRETRGVQSQLVTSQH
eukprot:6290947-Heterocapsa_arctica.AAC.1